MGKFIANKYWCMFWAQQWNWILIIVYSKIRWIRVWYFCSRLRFVEVHMLRNQNLQLLDKHLAIFFVWSAETQLVLKVYFKLARLQSNQISFIGLGGRNNYCLRPSELLVYTFCWGGRFKVGPRVQRLYWCTWEHSQSINGSRRWIYLFHWLMAGLATRASHNHISRSVTGGNGNLNSLELQ